VSRFYFQFLSFFLIFFFCFFFLFLFSFFFSWPVGRELVKVAKEATTGSEFVTFKTDEKTWGVTDINGGHLAAHSFGEYKNHTRLQAEAELTAYLCDFSKPRYDGGVEQFTIATAVAAPGTGKSRLLDDTVVGQIKSGGMSFDPSGALFLPITFNGGTTQECVHDVASRCVLEFFCGQPVIDDATLIASTDAVKNRGANKMLGAIDDELSRLVRGSVANVERDVLDALEALFFNARGGTLGRSVLLVDEISKASMREQAVYRSVVDWVDGGAVEVAGRPGVRSRRGAVFTGLSVVSPWAQETASARSVVRLALGLFDVWDAKLQDAILRDVRKRPKWANVTSLPAAFWSLLASAGGRPRDIENVLFRLQDVERINSVTEGRLMEVLSIPVVHDEHVVFRRYLLPSLLNVNFGVHAGADATQFGLDVTSRSLRNSDLLADTSLSSVPSVSLRFFTCLKGQLQSVFERLVRATTFCELRGDGKDFENVWVLLLQTHLLLQHRVRLGSDFDEFWPQADGVRIGGRRSPTGDSLQMFARGIARESALFKEPDKGRVYEAPESTIRREIHFDVTEPSLVMLWQNLWVNEVRGGALVSSLDASSEVEWKSPALVYFTQTNHDAIDFMLLVGEMGGSGATEPHVYMFQCKARTRDSVAAAGLQEIVDKLDAKLDKLFSRAFEGNVLRVAGINSKKQVTLCVAALHIGDNFTFVPAEAKSKKKKKLITPPFNVVLFDAASFRGLGGGALDTTRFMRYIDGKLAREEQ
jgi:hypothetical protein